MNIRPQHDRVDGELFARRRLRATNLGLRRVAFLWALLAGCGGGLASSACAATAATPDAKPKDPSAPTAKLLFKTNFGAGVTLAAPSSMSSTASWQDLKGTDAQTGFSFPVSALGSDRTGLQLIGAHRMTGAALRTDNLNEYFGNELRTTTGPDGKPASEIFFNLRKKDEPVGKGGSQIPLMINRPSTIGDTGDVYISYWFKHRADLAAQLDHKVSAGNWRVQFEFKTGGFKDPAKGKEAYAGDYRISTTILKSKDEGKLYWRSKGDNSANMESFMPGWKRVTYWTVENDTVPVPVGEWFKFEVFWHRSNGSDGRYWAAVNGQVIADHLGPNMGEYNLPITRIMVTNVYTGGYGPVQGEMTGLEIDKYVKENKIKD